MEKIAPIMLVANAIYDEKLSIHAIGGLLLQVSENKKCPRESLYINIITYVTQIV